MRNDVTGDGFHKVVAADRLAVGELLRVEVSSVAVCVAHAEDGRFYAIADTCSHEEASLSEGYIEGTEIECPMHSAIFDLRTGAVVGPPAELPIRTFEIVERDGFLHVRV